MIRICQVAIILHANKHKILSLKMDKDEYTESTYVIWRTNLFKMFEKHETISFLQYIALRKIVLC